MKPKPQPRDAFELFQVHFDQMLDPSHEFVVLANKIGWPSLDVAFADCYRPDIGAPGKAVRLMVGLHYRPRYEAPRLERFPPLCRSSGDA